jgi:peptidoglycan-associated lipoprotein
MTRRLLIGFLMAFVAPPVSAQMPALIFFEPHSAALGPTETEILRAFAAQAHQGGASVEILGFADPEGGIPYNRALSLARAEHAAQTLREMGVPADRVRIRARGPVASVLDDQESRRVELRLVP